jgi:serine/threonine-protein kinase
VAQYHKALDIYVNWYGREHPATAETLVTMGEALSLLGQYQAARDALTEGVALGDKVFEPGNEVMILALETLGTLEQNTGNIRGAIAYFEQTSRRVRATWGDDSVITAESIANLAVAHFKAGEYSQAEPLLREALNVLVRDLPAGHQNIATVQLNLGKTLLKERKFAEAEQTLQTALKSLSRLAVPRPELVQKADAALAELKRSRP